MTAKIPAMMILLICLSPAPGTTVALLLSSLDSNKSKLTAMKSAYLYRSTRIDRSAAS
jgi:hypothetical protein